MLEDVRPLYVHTQVLRKTIQRIIPVNNFYKRSCR